MLTSCLSLYLNIYNICMYVSLIDLRSSFFWQNLWHCNVPLSLACFNSQSPIMVALCLSALPSHTRFLPSLSFSPSKFSISSMPFSQYSHVNHQSVRLYTSTPHSASSTTASTRTTADRPKPSPTSETLFDWYSQWYPLATLRDLDKHAPKALTVMELDVVIWWDRVEGAWKVFDDRCPHRLAPLSEGRIDHWGRLQCVYHGWCFDGAGACKYMPQAPALGPPVCILLTSKYLL